MNNIKKLLQAIQQDYQVELLLDGKTSSNSIIAEKDLVSQYRQHHTKEEIISDFRFLVSDNNKLHTIANMVLPDDYCLMNCENCPCK